MLTRLLGWLVIFWGGCLCALAQGEYSVSRAASAIDIDGRLDEAAWRSATVIRVAYEWAPGDNVEPPVGTDGFVTYDDDNIYVAFRAQDPDPRKIRAHLMDRDSIETFVQDDHVVVLLDTFNDERRAFQFRVNPLGVQADAINSENEGIEDWSWDLIWDSAGRIDDGGYTIEIAIPLDQLRFPASVESQTWGIELGRSYPRSVRYRMASHPTDRNRSCGLCQLNKVDGFEGLRPGLNLEFDPTLTISRTDAAATPGEGLIDGDEDFEPGLSARWGVTPNLSLNATVNPDFSQVEADVAQLEVNEQFALFFPEKRPFFLEGADFFATPINAVFTRTVADPEWGAKLSGKVGKNTVGLFFTQDNVNNLVLPANQRSSFDSIDDEVFGAVARFRRDVGRNSTLGALYAGREGGSYHNRVGGVDGFVRMSQTDTLTFQYLHSDTRYPDSTVIGFGQPSEAFSGDAFRVAYNHGSRHWTWNALYEDLDRGFRADSGFVPRVDLVKGQATVARRFWGGENTWYTQQNIGLFGFRTEDQSGRLTDESVDLFWNVSGPLQSFLEVSLERNTRYVDPLVAGPTPVLHEELDRGQAFFQFQPGAATKASILVDVGETVDVNFGRRSDIVLFEPSVELKLGRHVNAKLTHTLQRLDDTDGGRLFELNLTQLRLIYNFNVRSFVRAVLQYRDSEFIDPDFVGLAGASEPENLLTELLFSYKLNPQSVIFAGYSDTQQGDETIDLTRSSRTFFFKLGYAWTL